MQALCGNMSGQKGLNQASSEQKSQTEIPLAAPCFEHVPHRLNGVFLYQYPIRQLLWLGDHGAISTAQYTLAKLGIKQQTSHVGVALMLHQ
jgi:hypothetical protein